MQTLTGLGVGTVAPDFKLKGPGGQPVTLSEYRGAKNVVLAFFPLAFSGTCSHQLPTIQQSLSEIEAQNAVVLGISVDSHHASTAFGKSLGLAFPLLSDWKRETGAAYGVLNVEAGYSGRALFVVDKAGKIAYCDVSPDPGDQAQIPSNQRLIEALKKLK